MARGSWAREWHDEASAHAANFAVQTAQRVNVRQHIPWVDVRRRERAGPGRVHGTMCRRLLLAIALCTAACTVGCDARDVPPELLGYVALFAGIALVAMVVLVSIALVLATLSAASILFALLNLRRANTLTRASGLGLGTVDLAVGLLLVAGEAWMDDIHFSWWFGLSAGWPALGGLWLISLGAFSVLAAIGVFADFPRNEAQRGPHQPHTHDR